MAVRTSLDTETIGGARGSLPFMAARRVLLGKESE